MSGRTLSEHPRWRGLWVGKFDMQRGKGCQSTRRARGCVLHGARGCVLHGARGCMLHGARGCGAIRFRQIASARGIASAESLPLEHVPESLPPKES